MTFVELATVLAPHGLDNPYLTALHPDCDLYSVMLYQPDGKISGNTHYVGNAESEAEKPKYLSFFRLAVEQDAALVATPEYSCPWSALDEAVNSDIFPVEKNIWAIACEGITFDNLNAFKEKNKNRYQIIFETDLTTTGRNFADPLCYLFSTRKTSNQEEVVRVILIQFKTEPMGDRTDYFERDHLIQGTKIYKVSNKTASISLVTLMCSDTLGLVDQASINQIHGRSIILHLQLNKNPRNLSFANYRKLSFNANDDDTEVICLNWAMNIFCNDTNPKNWENIGGTGIYLKSDKLETRDHRTSHNHKRGLYITYWAELRTYAHFFNYLSGVYHFRSTKPWQRLGTPQQKGRTGPEMLNFFAWGGDPGSWTAGDLAASDGFSEAIEEYTADLSSLEGLRDVPLNVERILALSCGHAGKKDWSKVENLQPCQIEHGETIRRISFAQDHVPNAVTARDSLLRPFGVLSGLIQIAAHFPVRIMDLRNNCRLNFIANSLFSNLYPVDGEHPATVVYLGENPRTNVIEKAYKDMKAAMGSAGADRERLVIWYRDAQGLVKTFEEAARPEADDDDSEHPTAIDGDHS